ncbi:RHS repeat domain-containing protein [Capnocytophaga leadbetteri]|uniref:RHS repeat domain-containing protein n=1 Tax=Capnocytophaga leadbetteri TaxID=327575 RepID=UPI0034E95E0F
MENYGKHYSIISDHLGTPIEAYNQEGELIWEREQDLYSNSRQGFAKENFRCPFKYQGQYYDSEVELCYNRFRYYHPEIGRYVSEDPIKLYRFLKKRQSQYLFLLSIAISAIING